MKRLYFIEVIDANSNELNIDQTYSGYRPTWYLLVCLQGQKIRKNIVEKAQTESDRFACEDSNDKKYKLERMEHLDCNLICINKSQAMLSLIVHLRLPEDRKFWNLREAANSLPTNILNWNHKHISPFFACFLSVEKSTMRAISSYRHGWYSKASSYKHLHS